MQKVINLTNKYIVLATPLILFTLISNTYLAVSLAGEKVLNTIFAIFLLVLMFATFIAGWFNMIKLAVIDSESDEPNSLIKEFPAGVGEYFLSSLGALFIFFAIFALGLFSTYILGINTIGDIGISTENLSKIIQSTAELKTFISSLSVEQLVKINLWNMLVLSSITLIYFLTMLYLPVLFFKAKNPLVAFLTSLKDLFSKKIFKSLKIFLFIFIINFLIAIFSALFANNIFMHFILTLFNFYFITAVGVGIFYYYYNNFIKLELGQNVDVKI